MIGTEYSNDIHVDELEKMDEDKDLKISWGTMEMCFGHLLHEANLSKHTKSNLALVFALCCGSSRLVKEKSEFFFTCLVTNKNQRCVYKTKFLYTGAQATLWFPEQVHFLWEKLHVQNKKLTWEQASGQASGQASKC